MRLTKIQWRRAGRPNLVLPFFAGFMAGGAFVYLNMDYFTADGGFLCFSSVAQIGLNEINKQSFFFYVLRKRIGTIWLPALLSTTFLGMLTTYGFLFFYGVSFGILSTVLIFRYGMRGLLFFAGSMIPQYIVYIPAFWGLALWCFENNVRLYHPTMDYTLDYDKKSGKMEVICKLLVIHGVVIIGCFLESYVNPNIMIELLKLFKNF